MDWSIHPYLPQALTPAQWEQIFSLRAVVQAEVYPHDPPPPPESIRRYMLDPHPLWDQLRWMACAGPSGELVAEGHLGLLKATAPGSPQDHQTASLSLDVLPAHRCQGIGSALLRQLAATARGRGITRLIGGFQHEAARAFLGRLGAVFVSERKINRLYLDGVDWAMLEDWRRSGPLRSPGAHLEYYINYMPDEVIPGYVEVFNQISAQTPDMATGDIELWAKTSYEDRRATEQVCRERHYTWVTLLAYTADNALCGLTHVYYTLDEPFVVYQDLTGVLEGCRGRGLGKWLKAEMACYIRDHFIAARFIQTGNADANAPMLAINNRMGFCPTAPETLYRLDLADLERLI